LQVEQKSNNKKERRTEYSKNPNHHTLPNEREDKGARPVLRRRRGPRGWTEVL